MTSVVFVLFAILENMEIVDIALTKIVNRDIPFCAADDGDVPFLDDLGVAVGEQIDGGLDIPDLLGMRWNNRGACQKQGRKEDDVSAHIIAFQQKWMRSGQGTVQTEGRLPLICLLQDTAWGQSPAYWPQRCPGTYGSAC